MLPKKFRLTKKRDFEKVLAEGKIIQGEFFGLAVSQDERNENPKVGFIISNKVSKKAVERNRIRRILREATKKEIEELSQKSLLVFLAKKSAVGVSARRLSRDAQKLLERVVK